MDEELGYEEFSTQPKGGPPSRQRVFLEDEDMTVLFVGVEVIPWRKWAWRAACVASFGILALAGLWIPTLWLRWVTKETAFEELGHDRSESYIVVETPYRDVFINPLLAVAYPGDPKMIFPRSAADGSRGSHTPGAATPRSGHKLQTLNGHGSNGNQVMDDLERGPSSSNHTSIVRMVDYRYARFVFNENTSKFRMLRDWRDPSIATVNAARNGVELRAKQQREVLFGPNVIEIAAKSTLSLLIDEALHPFYVFQIASMILWTIDDYWYYATCIGIISALSIITTLIETKRTVERMREMSRFSCSVRVLQNGAWVTVSSESLAPGDVVNIMEESLSLFPADMLLLSGDVIVNESMLTGESVPIAKLPIKDDDIVRWNEAGPIDAATAKGFLYTGTKIIRIRGVLTPTSGEQALAVVVRTGFSTTKGSLIRSMLFPKPMGFKFYRDSIRFVIFLAGLAGLGFLASAVQFVKLGIKLHIIVLRALDLITIVVPPALPATLSIGTSFAVGRLRKLGIFCISPNRVNVAGRINVVCFDKTGTLTEDGLDVLGARCIERSGDVFGELTTNVHDLPAPVQAASNANFLYALATCHSLKVVNGETIGDPLDAKMFEFTGWTIEEGRSDRAVKTDRPGSSRPVDLVQAVVRPPGSAQFKIEDALKVGGRHAHFLELGVIRTFEFVSSLRRMSVIVKRLKSTSMEIYVKGAPETMNEICDPSSFPKDYDDLLAYYTKNGYRVIAIAGKSIEGLSWLKAQRMKREQAESALQFLGLIIFENKLKAGTAPAIQVLQNAHLALRMATGDNHRTAISVARECGLIGQSVHVFVPTFNIGNAQTPASTLEWTSVDDDLFKLDPYSLKPIPPSHRAIDADDINYQDYTLAVTGDVFRWMINNSPLETLQRMFVKAQIFARMSPDEKHELVSRLQTLGYTVGFCGDGANDCGALKAADVGISLSEAEASVAAPFTSSRPDISCVIEVIKEGRAALVTSFSCFKYMALYSIIQFTTITLLYSFASSLGDFQFLYIDLFIIIPIAVTMGRTHPYTSIHRKQPTASLVSKKVLSSIIGQIVLTSAFQFWAFFWVRSQPWYTPPDTNSGSDELETYNYENTVLFLISSFQYVFVAAVFSIGPPYRLPMWTNHLLMISISALTVFSIWVLLTPPAGLARLLDIMPIPMSARMVLLLAAGINAILCAGLERWSPLLIVVTQVSRFFKMRRRRAVKEGKLYKAVEGGMR
ncbi:Ca-transporting ATPase [Clavulina sp. PMI_390]|nr:Ca-transporting ATPase [Clavulina sp. PMI_390]